MEDLSAEQALLGCIIQKGDLIQDVKIQADHLVDTKHRVIYKAMLDIHEKGEKIDLVSLNIHLDQGLGFHDSNYLADLKNSVPSLENIKQYEQYILDAYKISKAKEVISESFTQVTKPADIDVMRELLNQAQEQLESQQTNSFRMQEVLKEIYEEIINPNPSVAGISTGFNDLDRLLEGWKKQSLNIIAARPSIGKTAFMLSLAYHAAKAGEYATIFSLEMTSKQLLKRLLTMIARVDSMKLRNATKYFGKEDWMKVPKALGVLSQHEANIYIDDSFSPRVQDIRSLVRQNIKNHANKNHIVMIDYLSLIKGSGKENRNQEIGEITRALKKMARELDIAIVLLAQLSRRVEQRQDKRPMLSDLRDSGEIEQDADTITFLYRDDYYNVETEQKNILEVIVAKHRNGPVGKVELAFLKEYNAFVSLQRSS